MSYMSIHILNAQETLTKHKGWLCACLNETYAKACSLMNIPSLDVVIKVSTQVIPEKGHLGYSPEPGIIYINVDPENPVLRMNHAMSLERMFAHELHHAVRWTGPGYGIRLGEALISEGLAGHFSLELLGGEPEPWESIEPIHVQPYLALLSAEWDSPHYDHSAWFYGTGQLPRWLGYTAGFNIVARYLTTEPDFRASTLTHIRASTFRHILMS